MRLRALIGTHAGQIRDYSPVAARGALASGVAERVHVDVRQTVPDTQLSERPAPEKPKTTQSKRKG
jgi:hypothetical protein